MMTEDENRLRRIDIEVRETLASLDDLPDIEAGGYFFTRVRQRVQDAEPLMGGMIARWLFESRLGPALLALVILANLATVSITLTGSKADTVGREQYIEALSELYSLGASSPAWDISR